MSLHFKGLSCTYELLHELSLLASIVLLLPAKAVQKFFFKAWRILYEVTGTSKQIGLVFGLLPV